MPVVCIGEPDAGGFDHETKLAGVGKRRFGFGCWRHARKGVRFLRRNNGLFKRAIGQSDAALEAFGERARCFQDNRRVEMPRQGNLLAEEKISKLCDHYAGWLLRSGIRLIVQTKFKQSLWHGVRNYLHDQPVPLG